MATTPRFGLHYQALTDAPDGAALGGLLAADVDDWLCRDFPVVDTAARVALSGIPAGFRVLVLDDGSTWRWNGVAWVDLTAIVSGGSEEGGGGGGGGSTSIEGQWRATANQSLSNNIDTVLAFGTTEADSSVVSRATSGSGHKFTLTTSGTYAITATVRFQTGAPGSRFIELRNSAQSVRFVASGDQGGPAASTRTFSITKNFSATQELVVIATQASGGTLSTQYQGSSISDGFVRLTIVKLSG